MHIMEFQKTQLSNAKRVGIRLQEARISAGFSVQQICDKTKILPNYINALEACNFDLLPKGNIYRKQIIKAYAKTIGVDHASYTFQYITEEVTQREPKNLIPIKPHFSYFQDIPSIVRFAFLILLGFSTVGYLGLQINKIVQPPQLTLHSPANGLVTNETTIDVYGDTGKEVFISINGKNIPNDGSGKFNEKLDLSNGVNTIVVSANRKHGKSTTLTRHVILKETNQLSLMSN